MPPLRMRTLPMLPLTLLLLLVLLVVVLLLVWVSRIIGGISVFCLIVNEMIFGNRGKKM